MNAPRIPKPPQDIWTEMGEAYGDPVRLNQLKAKYRAWLADQGYQEHDTDEAFLGWYTAHERREDDR